ncbi:histone deacetylase domain-containing protein [Immersiella caudata]|uniref:Histone deacetylase domain-containing protein n=1 Tax=Immersiella caudata TaxID=314043 RepID=A0AA40C074_9PEZI|nr:histone deacetylase domain-containing protein [Immersiella caudata]
MCDDFTLFLNQLSISTASPAKSPRSPRPLAPGSVKPATRSPSTPRPGSSMRSPLNGSTATGTPSRSGTPTLLRKASLNSLHSANGVAPPRRASSANIYPPRSPLRSTSPEMPPLPTVTPESVASDYFQAELAAHQVEAASAAETIVILHDSCYGHRYSRPRTSRAALNTIVERPERLKACALGVSAAYVRLGERHEEGMFPVRPGLNPGSIPPIPFRIHKTTRRLSLTSQTVTNVHGVKWMEELKSMCESAEAKLAMNGKELQRPEMDRSASGETPQKLHEGDLYLCAESLDALEGSLGGVCDAVDAVFRPRGPKRAFVAIRPPGHHCSASYPSGFCWVNNVHVGIMHGILSHGLTHAAIIDFDLHHGDGSQSIAWQHNSRSIGLAKNAAWWKKTSIGYFSLHDINSYPCEMGDEEKVRNASICIDNAHGQNIWNVHLQPWKTEAEFFALYESNYLRDQTQRLRAAGLHSRAAIFLSAGFDASEWEGAGMQRHNVNVPTEFYARLTRDVVKIAAEEGTSVEGRIVSVLEGGYSDRALWDDPATKEQDFNGLGYEMGQRMGSVRSRKDSSASERGARRYEPSWWSAAELERLEQTMAPSLPQEPRKPRNTTPPTYSSPTQSFSAKIVVPKVRRSVSGLSPNRQVSVSRAPTPPPPEVFWPVAAHELSKLLIPSGRQTDSCKHEDLNAEATRARREKAALAQSVPPGAAPIVQGERAPTRMSLRERKAKPTLHIDEESEEDRKHRRRTVAGSAVLASERAGSRGGTPAPKRLTGRRLSAASTIVSERLDPAPSVLPAAPIRGVSRPDTSLTIRPESSMSVRVANGTPLPVKKTRAPAKKEPVQRAPRVPKKPAGTNGNGAPARRTSPLSATPVSASPEPTVARKTASDMDDLTNDMKKIKITLVTKAQREARERERQARERLAHADTISAASTPVEENTPFLQAEHPARLPSPPADITITTTPLSSPPVLGIPEFTSAGSSPGGQYFPDESSIEVLPSPSTPSLGRAPVLPQRVPFPSSSPASASPLRSPARSPTRNRLASEVNDVFIPYQPEGPPASPLKEQQQPLQWLPPNTATPTVMRRADLPVFTATSAIPFATPSPLKKREDLLWEVPETPEK